MGRIQTMNYWIQGRFGRIQSRFGRIYDAGRFWQDKVNK